MRKEILTEQLSVDESKLFDQHYVLCEFDDECDVCDVPQDGSYAVGLDYYGEVDHYICGKCAIKQMPKLMEDHRRELEILDMWCNEMKKVT